MSSFCLLFMFAFFHRFDSLLRPYAALHILWLMSCLGSALSFKMLPKYVAADVLGTFSPFLNLICLDV